MVYKTGKSHNNPSCRTFTLSSCSLQILKLCRVVDSNHSLWLSTSHLTTLRLHMILTKTSTRTDKSSSSQERLISLSPNLIFRRTPFYFVTYGPFCNLIGLQYTLQKEQLSIRPDPLCASMRVWLRETRCCAAIASIVPVSWSA